MTLLALTLAYAVLVQFNEYRDWLDLERWLLAESGPA